MDGEQDIRIVHGTGRDAGRVAGVAQPAVVSERRQRGWSTADGRRPTYELW